jgi:hypothetical protein
VLRSANDLRGVPLAGEPLAGEADHEADLEAAR